MKLTRPLFLAFGRTVALGAVFVVAACSHVGASPSKESAMPGGLADLVRDTGIEWQVMPNETYGTAAYVFPVGIPPVALTAGAQPGTVALAFLVKYGGIFGLEDPAQELVQRDSGQSDGLPFVTFTQQVGPATVLGSFINVSFDRLGRLTSVLATTVPNLGSVATTAALSASDAAGKAQTDMMKDFAPRQSVTLEAKPPPVLALYMRNGAPALVYTGLVSYALDDAIETSARQRQVAFYVVDANTGEIVEKSDGFRADSP